MFCPVTLLAGITLLAPAQDQGVMVRTAADHPMQYCISLPQGWNPKRTWPVVMVVPDAERDFRGNLEAFVRARGNRPFILVAPFVVTSGGASYRDNPNFRYAVSVWQEVDRVGDFAFDEAGMAAVLADVSRMYRGSAKAFLTGWEAGGHTVWAMAFRRPELWAGVAPVSSNWKGRWVDASSVSHAPDRCKLPLRAFFCGELLGDPAKGRTAWQQQTQEALATARAWGFQAPPIDLRAGRPHGPLAEDVLAWFQTLPMP